MIYKALVLAAGKSSRISSVAESFPKPLLEVGGEPVLIHNLKLLAKHHVERVWINLHYQPRLIRRGIGDGKKWDLSISYSYEKVLLGTSGAVKKLANEFSDRTFLVLYGDNFTDCNLTSLLRQHKELNSLATIAVFDQRKSLHSGIAGGCVLVDREKRVTSFVEGKAKKKSSNLVNAGIYVFEPEILRYIPKGFSDFGKDIFPMLLRSGLKLSIYEMSGFCLALDTPESYFRAQKIVSELPPRERARIR